MKAFKIIATINGSVKVVNKGNGKNLTYEIPTGMTGVQLVKFKKEHSAEISELREVGADSDEGDRLKPLD